MVANLHSQSVGPIAIDQQTGASFEVADEDLLRSLARSLAPDCQQSDSSTERANIARTISQHAQTRHGIVVLKEGTFTFKCIP